MTVTDGVSATEGTPVKPLRLTSATSTTYTGRSCPHQGGSARSACGAPPASQGGEVEQEAGPPSGVGNSPIYGPVY